MGKKRDKANDNIRILIDDYVNLEISSLGVYCPYTYEERSCEQYEGDCGYCKEEYKEKLRDRLEEKYIVK